MARTIEYRIPIAPLGSPYYRAGRLYEPGEKVRIPEDEVPGGWVRDPNTGKPVPFLRNPKTGKITKRVNPSAWKRLTPGVREADEEKLSELEKAKVEMKALAETARELQRRIEELEGDTGQEPELEDEDPEEEPEPKEPGEPKGEEDPEPDDAGGKAPEPAAASTEVVAGQATEPAEEPKGKRGKKRAQDQDL